MLLSDPVTSWGILGILLINPFLVGNSWNLPLLIREKTPKAEVFQARNQPHHRIFG
jgi:hypothetical protein